MSIVIIGAGLAGYNLVKEIRKLDADVEVRVVTADVGEFYSKPMLSNAFAKGKSPEQLVMNTAAQMSERYGIQVDTHCDVTKIDRAKKQITTSNGQVTYNKLVLAVGATPRTYPVDDTCADRVISINHLDDYRRFRESIDRIKQARSSNQPVKIALIGGGLIGCEFANDLANQGFEVEIIEPTGSLMGSLLPNPVSLQLSGRLQGLGVRVLHTTVDEIVRHESNDVLQLKYADGSGSAVDVAVSAIGMAANTQLAASAGLSVNRGICVNGVLETSDPNIFALGDCAEVSGHLLFYIMPLMACARALAKTLIGQDRSVVAYGPMPVTVKTPACPLVVLPPPNSVSNGEWQFEQGDADHDIKAVYYDSDGVIRGFALSGECIKEKAALSKQTAFLSIEA